MRIVLFAILSLLIIRPAFGQEKIATYSSSELNSSFNISASLNQTGDPVVYLEVFNGLLRDTYYFQLDDEIQVFIQSLSSAKDTFAAWNKRAKENKVDYTTKRMPINFPQVSVFHYDAFDKKFTQLETIELIPIFTFSSRTGCQFQLSALSGLVKDQAYSIVFGKVKEFDKLISKIEPNVVCTRLESVSERQ